MPFVDDFSYTKTALEFARTGHFVYNGWATAMLGWLVPWGALFIKLFGFSFNVMRLSMLPIDLAAVYLFHDILRRFGINPANAVLGALTMALSPLFLPLAATYMTDIPGLFVILVCMYMCQRAVAARTDRAALLWLIFATLVNIAGGTVRQIAWLGALVMVPSTAWLLRRRRRMKLTGVLLWILAVLCVLACMHWFSRQPYSIGDFVIASPIQTKTLIHLAAQYLKTLLCLLLIILPVTAAWLASIRRLSPDLKRRFLAIAAAFFALVIASYVEGILGSWIAPWLGPVLVWQSMSLPGFLGATSAIMTTLLRIFLSILVISPLLVFGALLMHRRTSEPDVSHGRPFSWKELGWIGGPFSLAYLLLLAPSGTFSIIQDRYVLGLIPVAIAAVLKLYQQRITGNLSKVSVVTVVLFAIYAIGGTHDLFSRSRALVSTVRVLQNSGVKRNLIQAGLASDGWFQIRGGGFMNDVRIQVPAGAYKPYTYELQIPKQCRYEFMKLTPSIQPTYFIVPSPLPCFAPTQYPPVHYTAWLPPFHRALYVQRLK